MKDHTHLGNTLNKQLYTTEEIAVLLKCSPGHLYNLRSKGMGIGGVRKQIPYIKRGKQVFYDLDDVTAYFNEIEQRIGG